MFRKKYPGPYLLLAAMLLPRPAAALPFNIGEVEALLDTQLEFTTVWATQSADNNFVGANNGGKGLSTANDDGRLNFSSGDSVSRLLNGSSALELRYQDSGLYLRGNYWYDFALMDQNQPFKMVENGGRQQGAKSSGGELLDAFVYQHYSVAEQPGTLRAGRQVLVWGESLFIDNGLSQLNPQRAAAYRQPVTPLREGMLPTNLLQVSQALNEALELEAFYQVDWQADQAENCGTFFAQADYSAAGCSDNLAMLNTQAQLLSSAGPAGVAALQGLGVNWGNPDEGVLIARKADREPGDSGQFGVALRYFAAPLETQFGLYAMHYHSRSAYLGVTTPDSGLYTAAASEAGLAPLVVAGNTQYFMGYPEDVQLYGLSFASTLRHGTRWAGELTYRPNAPLQLNTIDLLNAAQTPLDASQSTLQMTPTSSLSGYRRKAISQLQSSLSQAFDNVMGASQLTLQGEIALVHVAGLESRNQARYGRDPVFGSGNLPDNNCASTNSQALAAAGASQTNASRYCDGDGFVTSSAWGYRTRAIWEYPNVLPGLTLKPNLAWAHDVAGYGPNQLFNQGAKATSVGVVADYEQTWQSSVVYSNFFGGDFNTASDRDFVQLSLGLRF